MRLARWCWDTCSAEANRRPPTGCWRPGSARRRSAPSSAERRTSWSPSNRQTSPPSLSRSRSANANRSRAITTSSSRRAIWESLSATNNMAHTLRTTAKRWGIEICASIPLPLLLFAAGVFMCFAYIKEGGPVWGVVVFVVWTIVLLVRAVVDVLSLLWNKIVIDDQAISGRINEESFSLRWKEVIAVWDSTTQNQPCLIVGARDGKVTIPLKFFNEKLLRDLIRLHVAPEAFEKDAFKRMPGYRVRHAANERVIREAADESLRVVGKAYLKVLGWGIELLFLGLAVSCWLAGKGAASLLFLFLAALQTY